jgi:transposase
VLRLPVTHIRSLIWFASGAHVTLLGSCLAALRSREVGGYLPGRGHCSTGDPIAGLLSRGRERDLPGSQAIRPVPLPRSTTPAEPTTPRLFDGFVDAAPTLPTARASAVDKFRGSITRLQHLLPTLQEWCCHHPCKARFRLAGSPLPGGSCTLWIATKGFRSHSSPFSGFILAQGKPYSDDLRERVIAAIEAGHTREEVAELFNMALSTVGGFIKRKRETGSVSPDKFGGYKTFSLEPHTALVKELVAEQPDSTLAELQVRLEKRKVKVSQSGIFRFLRHIKLTFKKKSTRS